MADMSSRCIRKKVKKEEEEEKKKYKQKGRKEEKTKLHFLPLFYFFDAWRSFKCE
jgi:hypothetical protein